MVQMSIGLDIQKIYLYFSVYKQMPVYIFAYIFTAMPQQGMIVRALELFDRTTQFFLSFFFLPSLSSDYSLPTLTLCNTLCFKAVDTLSHLDLLNNDVVNLFFLQRRCKYITNFLTTFYFTFASTIYPTCIRFRFRFLLSSRLGLVF